jgi:hypothetical protein
LELFSLRKWPLNFRRPFPFLSPFQPIAALPECPVAVNSGLDLADVAQLVEQLIRNQ